MSNDQTTTVQLIPLDKIAPSFGNDRTQFDESKIIELAESIKANGLAQPITVRPMPGDLYQLIAGERRYRAHKHLCAEVIRAIVVEMSDDQAARVMLAENTARADLDPIDEANAYARRMKDYNWTHAQVASAAGVAVQTVHNRLKLLNLREDIQFLVRKGQLSVGYAAVIADAELDNNRQAIALKWLNECPAPTIAGLRKECVRLAEAQAQTGLFDNCLFSPDQFQGKVKKQEFKQTLPADPKTDKAPMTGKTYRAMIENQIAFWREAADKWDRYGKTTQRDRCLAAADALAPLLAVMPADHANKRMTKKAQDGKTYAIYEVSA